MRLIWAVLCERSVIDRDTNMVSLINVLEEMTMAVQPPPEAPDASLPQAVIPVPIELVTLWARSDEKIPERGRYRVRLLLPDDRVPADSEFEVDLTQFLRLRHRSRFPGLPVAGEGTYHFVVEEGAGGGGWATMSEVPLRVVVQTQEPA